MGQPANRDELIGRLQREICSMQGLRDTGSDKIRLGIEPLERAFADPAEDFTVEVTPGVVKIVTIPAAVANATFAMGHENGDIDNRSLLIPVRDTQIFIRKSGSGYPVLLLHGFPQTHVMWRGVAHLLAEHFTVICADLIGYGQSGCPASDQFHNRYSKRAMANDMVALMNTLGFNHFTVVGHDRGGRLAYRMALDHPDAISSVAVLDIIPGLEVWDRINAEVMLAFWPWSFMAQPAPLPEQLVVSSPGTIIDHALTLWGSSFSNFDPLVHSAYQNTLEDPERVHAICEEFRAAASIDRDHDRQDRDAGIKIKCPLLAIWSAEGGLNRWYEQQGGPIGIWSLWADIISGGPVRGGHFFPEEFPLETAVRLKEFFLSHEPQT